MTPRRTIGLVAGREFRDRGRNKGFLIGTILVAVIFAGAVVAPALIGADEATFTVGVLPTAPDGFDQTAAAAAELQGAELTVVALADEAEAAMAVEGDDADAALLDAERLMVPDSASVDGQLVSIVNTALQQVAIAEEAAALDLTDEQLAAVLAPRSPVTVIDPEGEAGPEPTSILMAIAATILLFLTIQINGNSLLTGAIEEKSSRVVEVLLGTLRPWQLLAGKLTAMTALAVIQVAVIVGAGLGANAVARTVDVPAATGATVAISLAMVVIGFAFYAALYAVAGSLASSIEDAQGSAGPLAFVTVGVYMLAIMVVIPHPSGLLAQVLSFLPPTAPFVVPARVALASIPLWQAVVACLVTLAGAVLTIRLAGRLYSAAVLAGGRLTWRDAWRAEPIR